MEMRPSPEHHEFSEQPDLLAAFADREVTVFGMRGRFQDLAGMCPIDLQDPSVSIAAKNEFVVKVANESQLEIEQEYQGIFATVTDQLGLERKFTVVTPPVATHQAKEPSQSKNIAAKTSKEAQSSPKVTDEATLSPQVLQIEATRVQASSEAQIQDTKYTTHELAVLAQASATEEDKNEAIAAILNYAPETPLDVQQHVPASHPELVGSESLQAEVPAAASHEQITQDVLEQPQPFVGEHMIHENTQESAETTQDIVQETLFLPPAHYESFAPQPEAYTTPLTHETAAEPIPTPPDPYRFFSDAIANFQAIENEVARATEELDSADTTASSESMDSLTLLPVFITLSERLQDYDTRTSPAVATALHNIMVSAQALRTITEQDTAEPEIIVGHETRLLEQCIELFKQLDLEYEDSDVQVLVHIMLRAAPAVRDTDPQDLSHVDLENSGTREAKYSAPQFAAALLDVEPHIKHVLGIFAVFYSRPSLRTTL